MSNQTPETFQTFEPLNVEPAPVYEAMPEMQAMPEAAAPEMAAMPEMQAMPEAAAPTYESMPEFDALPEAPQPKKAKKSKKAKTKKNWFCRIFVFLLSIAPILIYFLLPIKHLTRVEDADGFYYAFENVKFFEHMFNMITGQANTDFFGVLPMHLNSTATIDMAITTIMYALPVGLVIGLIFGFIALCSKKAASYCLRFITGLQFVFSALYAIALILIAAWYDGPEHARMAWTDGIDYSVLIIAGVSFLIYTIASIVKAKWWAVLDLFIFLLTATSVGGVAYGLISNSDVTRNFLTGDANGIYGAITLGLIGADMFFLICGLIGISAKKLYGIDLVRAIFMTAVGGFLVVLSITDIAGTDLKALLLPSIIAAGSAFLMLVIEAITIGVRNSKKKAKKVKVKKEKKAKKVKEAPVVEEAPTQEFVPMEAPVAEEAPIAMPIVEEAPAFVPVAPIVEAPVEPAEPFDAFLVTLSKEEKEEFGALTLKLQKSLPDIPRYETGADNKVFFRRIFVNLGSVRGWVSDELMEKLYQHTVQL